MTIGKPLLNIWKPYDYTLYKEGMVNKNKLVLCDCPMSLPQLPIMSKRAVSVLMPLMEDSVEILPLNFLDIDDLDYKYFMVNVLSIVDCVDWNLSSLEFSKRTGKLMEVLKFSLIEDALKNNHIFHILLKDKNLNYPTCKVYVSDKFRNTVIKNKITGLKFHKIWYSE